MISRSTSVLHVYLSALHNDDICNTTFVVVFTNVLYYSFITFLLLLISIMCISKIFQINWRAWYFRGRICSIAKRKVFAVGTVLANHITNVSNLSCIAKGIGKRSDRY